MQISVSGLKANTGKYLALVDDQEVIITKNGKRIAKLVTAKVDKKESVKALIGALPLRETAFVQTTRLLPRTEGVI